MGYIEAHKPNIVIMENVKNLMQKSKAWEGGHNLTHLDVAAKRFNTNSHHLSKRLMDAQDYALPQSRTRW